MELENIEMLHHIHTVCLLVRIQSQFLSVVLTLKLLAPDLPCLLVQLLVVVQFLSAFAILIVKELGVVVNSWVVDISKNVC